MSSSSPYWRATIQDFQGLCDSNFWDKFESDVSNEFIQVVRAIWMWNRQVCLLRAFVFILARKNFS